MPPLNSLVHIKTLAIRGITNYYASQLCPSPFSTPCVRYSACTSKTLPSATRSCRRGSENSTSIAQQRGTPFALRYALVQCRAAGTSVAAELLVATSCTSTHRAALARTGDSSCHAILTPSQRGSRTCSQCRSCESLLNLRYATTPQSSFLRRPVSRLAPRKTQARCAGMHDGPGVKRHARTRYPSAEFTGAYRNRAIPPAPPNACRRWTRRATTCSIKNEQSPSDFSPGLYSYLAHQSTVALRAMHHAFSAITSR